MGRPPRSAAGSLAAARRLHSRITGQLRQLGLLIDVAMTRLPIDARAVAVAFDALIANGSTRPQAMAHLSAQFERTPKHIDRLIRDGHKALKTLGNAHQ